VTAALPLIAPAADVDALKTELRAINDDSAGIALFALALGVAGTLLGVTVVWFFAAIPLGLAAVIVGALALRGSPVGRARSRAVLGIALGSVALLLGTLSAILVPLAIDRADGALTRARDDVYAQMDQVDSSLASDVDRLDGTITREMRELERQNHRELGQFEETSTAALRQFERRMAAAEKNLPAQQKLDLARLERQLRTELAALNTGMRNDGTATLATMNAMADRIVALETALGLAAPPPPAAPAETAAPVTPVETGAAPIGDAPIG
jgi:hypothetical protein